jgi:hypothetical protein
MLQELRMILGRHTISARVSLDKLKANGYGNGLWLLSFKRSRALLSDGTSPWVATATWAALLV